MRAEKSAVAASIAEDICPPHVQNTPFLLAFCDGTELADRSA
jgi:hypothetical protein